MEILFCDLCNESVPVTDLNIGRAFRIKGRVVCASCNRAMGTEQGEAARASRSAGGGTLLAAPPAPARTAVAAPRPAVQDPDDAAPAPGGGGGVLVGLVALLFAAAGFAILTDLPRRRGRSRRP